MHADTLGAPGYALRGELPAVLASCRANLDPGLSASRLVRRALGQAATGPGFLRDSLPAEVSDPQLRARLLDAAGPAIGRSSRPARIRGRDCAARAFRRS